MRRALNSLLAVALVACGGSASTPPEKVPLPSGACGDGSARSIVSVDELDSLRGCMRHQGDLHLSGAALQYLEALHLLRFVDGSVRIGPTLALETLSGLSALEDVTGDFEVVSNIRLSGVFLRELRGVGGDLEIDHNSGTAVSLQELERVGGDLRIAANGDALRIDLGRLGEVGGDVLISGNRVVEEVVLVNLNNVGGNVEVDLAVETPKLER